MIFDDTKNKDFPKGISMFCYFLEIPIFQIGKRNPTTDNKSLA